MRRPPMARDHLSAGVLRRGVVQQFNRAGMIAGPPLKGVFHEQTFREAQFECDDARPAREETFGERAG